MHDLSVGATSLAEGWVSSTLSGVNIVLYFICINVLLQRVREQPRSSRWLIVASTIQIIICITHSSVFLAKNEFVFVGLDDQQRMQYLYDEGSGLHVAEECLYTINDWIGSGVLVWRAYVINNRNWKLIVPLAVLWFGLFIALIGALDRLAHLRPGSNVFDPSLGVWVLVFTVLSFLVQLGATALIAWRIWTTVSWRERRTWTREWHALRIVVESGAIYGLLTVLSLVFYVLRVNFGAINLGILVQMSATAPYLMIIRGQALRKVIARDSPVKLELNHWNTTTTTTRTAMESPQALSHPSPFSSIAMPPDTARSHYTVELQLQQSMHMDVKV